MKQRNGMRVFIVCLIMVMNPLGCKKHNPVISESRYPIAALQNIDVDQLATAIDALSSIPGIKSIVLGRNGVIAAEEYFHDGSATALHDVRSVTKSVMGLLVGIAIREGYIEHVDQTIGELGIGSLYEEFDPAKAAITIGDLLTMSCGLGWHELDGGNSYSVWYHSDDQVKWVLDQSFIHQPGNGFNYNTGSTHLLSVILSLASGQSMLDFDDTYLFQPMGITDSDWTVVPPGGDYNNGGAGLSLTPRSMFVIGSLMLNRGRWEGAQIVPEAWVAQCTSRLNNTRGANPYGSSYGYLWWVGTAHGHDLFYAMGWGGQFIVCVPDYDLVVAATCRWQGLSDESAGQHWYDLYMGIMDDLVTAVDE